MTAPDSVSSASDEASEAADPTDSCLERDSDLESRSFRCQCVTGPQTHGHIHSNVHMTLAGQEDDIIVTTYVMTHAELMLLDLLM